MEEQRKLTRNKPGRKAKYQFSGMKINEPRLFKGVKVAGLLGCAKNYISYNQLEWRMKSWTTSGGVMLMRVA